jgi:hypothetical protein
MKQLIFICMLALFAACNTTAPEITPEQLPINATAGIYGVTSTQAVWPVWSVQVIWYRSGGIYGDHVGPFTVQMQFKTKPTRDDVQKYVPQPAGLPGTWKVQTISNVVQIGAQQPIEMPTPKSDGLKEIPTWGE